MKQIYKKLLAAALGVSMLLSMVGCGQNDTSDQTQTGGENEAKVLTIVTAKELDSLTTLTMNKENNIACGLVYETLVAYEDGEIVPELAEEWGWDETNTALNVSNDNVIDLPISYSKDLVVYNSSKIAGYTFSSVPQFFEIDNVQPAE